MKKLVKWSAIAGVVLCLLGTGIITAGAMMGGMDELNLYFNQYDLNHVVAPAAEIMPLEPSDRYVRYENIRILDAEIGAGNVELRELEELTEQEIAVEHFGDGNPYLVEQKGNELEISFPDFIDRKQTEGMESLVIGVPVGYRFDELNIEAKAGAFYAEQVSAERLSLDAEAGEIQIHGGNVHYLEADAKAGAVNCQAVVEQAASAECSAGSVELLLAGEKKDYDYQLECSAGTIILNGEEPEEFTQLHQKKNINNRTGKNVDLECQMGTITIDYLHEGE